jgi:large repetitive protein
VPFDVTSGTLSINGFIPMSGTSGTQVNIFGNGFNGVDTVLFGNLAANYFVPSDGQITAFAPPALVGTSVSITVRKGISSANSGSLRFTYADTQSLRINSFSPTSGPEGTPIQVLGSGFMGVEAAFIGNSQTAYSVQSDTSMTVWVPGGAQDGPIRLMEAGVTVQSTGIFDVTVGTPFNISGVNPPTGAPGTIVTISGSGFTGVDTVLFGNVAASFSVNTDNRITATAPNGAAGSQVLVTLRKGAQQVSSAPLVYTYPASGGGTRPVVSGFTPNPALPGGEVRVFGSGFTGTTMVRVGLVNVAFNVVNDTDLRITAPDFSVSGRIAVTNASGTGVSFRALIVI